MDINKNRLEKPRSFENNFKKWGLNQNFQYIQKRKDALKDAEFVQTTIQVGGYRPSTLIDFEIPKKFGLQQTIADTLWNWGNYEGLRTIPVLLDIAEDINKICPQCYMDAIR